MPYQYSCDTCTLDLIAKELYRQKRNCLIVENFRLHLLQLHSSLKKRKASLKCRWVWLQRNLHKPKDLFLCSAKWCWLSICPSWWWKVMITWLLQFLDRLNIFLIQLHVTYLIMYLSDFQILVLVYRWRQG